MSKVNELVPLPDPSSPGIMGGMPGSSGSTGIGSSTIGGSDELQVCSMTKVNELARQLYSQLNSFLAGASRAFGIPQNAPPPISVPNRIPS